MSPRKRSARRQQEEEEEEEEEQMEVDDEQAADEGEGSEDDNGDAFKMHETKDIAVTAGAQKAFDALDKGKQDAYVRDLVRLALFCENRKMPLKRDEISKRAFEGDKAASRAFVVIFRKAQKQLRRTFGYELVEMRQRGVKHAQLQAQEAAEIKEISDNLDAKKAKKDKGKDKEPSPSQEAKDKNDNSTTGVKQWMVRSVLPYHLREMMVVPIEQAKAAMEKADYREGLKGKRLGAACALDWVGADNTEASMGLLYVVLALILVNGRSMTDAKLKNMLARLGLASDLILPRQLRPDDTPSGRAGQQNTTAARDNKHSAHTVQDLLDLWLRQFYLEVETTTSNAGQQHAAASRAGAPGARRKMAMSTKDKANRNGETEKYEWRWGPRAEAEVSEQVIARFATELMTAQEDAKLRALANGEDEEAAEEEEDEDEAPRQAGKRGAASQRGKQSQTTTPAQRKKAVAAMEKELSKLRDATWANIERSAGSALIGN